MGVIPVSLESGSLSETPYIYWEGGAPDSVPPLQKIFLHCHWSLVLILFPSITLLSISLLPRMVRATNTMASQKGTVECPSCSNNNTDNKSSDGNDIEDLTAPSPAAAPLLLRSQGWYDANVPSKDHIYHRSWIQNQGHPTHLLDGTHPIIAVRSFQFVCFAIRLFFHMHVFCCSLTLLLYIFLSMYSSHLTTSTDNQHVVGFQPM